MESTFIIEKLILEIDLNNDQEYSQFANYLQVNLYPLLKKELNELLPVLIENKTQDIQVERIELELPALSFHDMKSTKFIAYVKESLEQQIDKSRHTNRPNINSSNSTIANNTTENTLSSNQTIITKQQSLEQYLLVGQFILGVELNSEEIKSYFVTKETQNSIINWILKRPPKTQQQILLRLGLQLPAPQKISFFKHPSIQQLSKSLPIVFLNNKEDQEDKSTEVTSLEKTEEKKDFTDTIQIILDKDKIEKRDILNLPEKRTVKKQEPSIKNEIYVQNAGIVIIAEHLPILFRSCELLNTAQNAFKNQYCIYYAIHLLEFLVNKTILKTEDTTLLYKLLCGLPLDAPIATKITLEEADKQHVDDLLLKVIQKWPIKLGTHIDSLRSLFLIRNGKLSRVNNDWRLHIETKIYDKHLLSTFPGYFRSIKLPWMPHRLQVDWY